MGKFQKEETDAWRILLFGGNGSELLLARSPSGLRLPELRIPRWQRIVPNLNAEAKRLWNLDTVCLFAFDAPRPERAAVNCKYHVMEVCRPEELARVAPGFVLLSNAKEASFADKQDYWAVQQGMGFERGSVPKGCQGPFSEFGTFRRISAWVEEQLRPLGLGWDGNFRQLQASASFALVEFQTNRGRVWFKAVGEPNLREFPITMHLADRLPRHIPVLIARHPEWNAWLAVEAEGQDLNSCSGRDAWCRAADSLAELQIASIENAPEILAAGARDLRIESLLALAAPFFAKVEGLMERQTNRVPKRLTGEETERTRQTVIRALREMEAIGIPETINHLDLNPGNIFVAPAKCTFLDWAEAAVGNPFFSLEYLRQHFVRAFEGQENAETALLARYLDRWRSSLPAKSRETALRLAPLTALFAYAASSLPWHLSLTARPELAGLIRSLMRRMHRESEELTTSQAASSRESGAILQGAITCK